MPQNFPADVATSRLIATDFAAAITPADDTDLPAPVTRIWVGTGGNLKATLVSGDVVTYTNIPDGTDFVGRRIARVWATGTTATGLIGERS